MEIKGGVGGLIAALVGVAAVVGFAFLLGIPQIFGLSFGWGWGAVDHGTTTKRVLTPTLTDVKSTVFLSKGEELVAVYDFGLESGRAQVSLYTWGLVPAWGDLETFHQDPNIRGPVRREVRVVVPQTGFYTVTGSIIKATGDFTIDWEVEHPTGGAQVFRAVGLLARLWPLVLVALFALALGAAGLRAMSD